MPNLSKINKLQEFLTFFGTQSNPVIMKEYWDKWEQLKKRYSDKEEFDNIIGILKRKGLIQKSEDGKYDELSKDGQYFIDEGGFVTENGKVKNVGKEAWFYDIIKISAGIVALYYLIELLKEFMAFISYYFN